MNTEQINRIWREIELNIQGSDAWPEYKEAMRGLLDYDRSKHSLSDRDPIRWVLLPGLSCQAAGGDPLWADQVAAAWFLFYFAAHMMDSVIDQDDLDATWAGYHPSAAINASSGMYFGASRSLNLLHKHPQTKQAAADLVDDFYNSLIVMASGQHRELKLERPNLEQYWQIAEAKSGAFFALACRSGARLASDDKGRVAAFGDYGAQLGILLQIKDDLEDCHNLEKGVAVPELQKLHRSLPFVYAASVLPADENEQLDKHLAAVYHDHIHAQSVLELIEASGFVLYLAAEIEQRQQRAESSLEEGKAIPSAKAGLSGIIQDLGEIL